MWIMVQASKVFRVVSHYNPSHNTFTDEFVPTKMTSQYEDGFYDVEDVSESSDECPDTYHYAQPYVYSDACSDECSEECSDECPDECSEECPDEYPEEHSEAYLRGYDKGYNIGYFDDPSYDSELSDHSDGYFTEYNEGYSDGYFAGRSDRILADIETFEMDLSNTFARMFKEREITDVDVFATGDLSWMFE